NRKSTFLVGGEGVVFDLDHPHRKTKKGLLYRIDHVGHRVSSKPPSPSGLGAAEGALPGTSPRGHQDVRSKIAVRGSKVVQLSKRCTRRREYRSLRTAIGATGDLLKGFVLLHSPQNLQKRRLAFPQSHKINRGVSLEDLLCKRRGMGAT